MKIIRRDPHAFIKIENPRSDLNDLIIPEQKAFEILTRYLAVEKDLETAVFVFPEQKTERGNALVITKTKHIRTVLAEL